MRRPASRSEAGAVLQCGAFVAQNRLGQARRDGADTAMARSGAFDDGDVGVPDVVLDLLPDFLEGSPVVAE
jgi:hypothetical protein